MKKHQWIAAVILVCIVGILGYFVYLRVFTMDTFEGIVTAFQGSSNFTFHTLHRGIFSVSLGENATIVDSRGISMPIAAITVHDRLMVMGKDDAVLHTIIASHIEDLKQYQQNISGNSSASSNAAPSDAVAGGHIPANIDYEGIVNYGNYNPEALANPNVGAVDISMNWSQVEPQQGIFNFAPADKVMADWSNAGKKFTLIIRYIKENENHISCSSNQQFLPSWEIARIKSFCDSDQGILMPDYFDPIFKADLKAYVQAIATHIAQSPYKNNLLYVRAAVGMGGEGFPYFRKGDYQTVDVPQLQSFGYTPTVWAAWQKELLTFYKQAFSYATVIYPLNGQDIDPATGLNVVVENAQWAASQGIGLGQQGLQPKSNFPFLQQFRAKYPNLYIQFQTIWSVGNTQGIVGDIQAADKNGAQFIEWYTTDIVNPANQSSFAQWQQTVSNTY